MSTTTAELAKELGRKPKTIRKHAILMGVKPAANTVKTGQRGRPAFTWTAKAAASIRKSILGEV